jgi:ACS family hexuronate transporter-like MFS transporter
MNAPLSSLAKEEPPPRAAAAVAVRAPAGAGSFRWWICLLLFLAATINYVDRNVISLLKPLLAAEFHFDDVAYGHIVTAFQLAYAIGMLSMGRLLDAIGTRRGFALAALIWGVAAMGHAFAASALGFAIARLALGFGESGMFPAAMKTIGQWFPRTERALATGLFNAGTTAGAVLAPIAIPFVVKAAGPRAAFVSTGMLDLVWVMVWLSVLSPGREQASTAARGPTPGGAPTLSWWDLLRRRQTGAYAAAKFLTDPFWWLYLFWVPDFLNRRHGLQLSQMALPLAMIYLLSGTGSVAGGWLSSRLIRLGWTVNAARKVAMLAFAGFVAPIAFAANVESPWMAAVFVGLAAAGHQGFSANLLTLTPDLFPECAVGSAVGIGGMAGAVGGIVLAQVVGRVLQSTGSYAAVFLAPPVAYLLAIGVIHALLPRLEPLGESLAEATA